MAADRSVLVRLRAIARWLKSHPIVAVLGVIGTLFTVVKGAPAAWTVSMHALGYPACVSYAKVYQHAGGRFEKTGDQWIEYPPPTGRNHFRFQEVRRDHEYIYLKNLTPRAGPQNSMVLRPPVCGGAAEWTYQRGGLNCTKCGAECFSLPFSNEAWAALANGKFTC